MRYRTQSLIFMDAAIDYLQTCINDGPGNAIFVTPKIALFTAIAGPLSPATVYADLELAARANFAPKTLVFDAAQLNGSPPYGFGFAANALWEYATFDTPVVNETYLGYVLYNTGGTVLLFGEVFPSPITLPYLGDYLNMEFFLPFDNPAFAG